LAGVPDDVTWRVDVSDKPVEDREPVVLPAPVLEGCRDLFEALKRRQTSRDISTKKVSEQTLSDILWAAQGVNRAKGPFGDPGRTAGSASNSQEIRIYVLMEEGTYPYEPGSHRLAPVATGDLRRLAIGRGQQPAGADAPVRLVYVGDVERFRHAGFPEPGLYDPEVQKSYYFVDTGLIAQNVYLAAASLGLAAWFHNCDKEGFAEAIGLGPDLRPLFGQTVGWTADRADAD
jgi:nitroreductase